MIISVHILMCSHECELNMDLVTGQHNPNTPHFSDRYERYHPLPLYDGRDCCEDRYSGCDRIEAKSCAELVARIPSTIRDSKYKGKTKMRKALGGSELVAVKVLFCVGAV